MTVTVGINGFGRIGHSTLADIAESAKNDVQVVKINATDPVETNAHLLRYNRVHGRFPGIVTVAENTIEFLPQADRYNVVLSPCRPRMFWL